MNSKFLTADYYDLIEHKLTSLYFTREGEKEVCKVINVKIILIAFMHFNFLRLAE